MTDDRQTTDDRPRYRRSRLRSNGDNIDVYTKRTVSVELIDSVDRGVEIG